MLGVEAVCAQQSLIPGSILEILSTNLQQSCKPSQFPDAKRAIALGIAARVSRTARYADRNTAQRAVPSRMPHEYNSANTQKGMAMDEARKRALCIYLTKRLLKERLDNGGFMPPRLMQIVPPRDALEGASTEELWLAFRALVNVREPWPADDDLLAAQDELLQGLIAEAGITTVDDTTPSPLDGRLRLWRGDITTLAADAIVNAANSGMTGCWAPLHYCIDNAIHTFAGIQLRLECARIMQLQGYPEPTGQAKLTPAYNLPSRHVVHTVGPIADGTVNEELRAQLASSYRACLEAAAQAGDASIALCCISTGVFGFPADEASRIAAKTVRRWLSERDAEGKPALTVVFNVFGEADEHRYRALLGL